MCRLLRFCNSTSLKGSTMKVIQQFDEHSGEWISAVQKNDTAVALLSNHLSRPGFQLYEVWILDENGQMISPALLEKMCFSSIEALSAFYCPETSQEPLRAASRELDLVHEVAIGLRPVDACFHHSVQQTANGPVCSIVFGSPAAMHLMYERGLRSPLSPVTDDESSV